MTGLIIYLSIILVGGLLLIWLLEHKPDIRRRNLTRHIKKEDWFNDKENGL